ncbi:MAG: DUF6057 family protein [Phocaeicola sp.]
MTQHTRKTDFGCMLQTALFGLICFFFWAKVYPAHLHFQEQFQLFQSTSAYFIETASLPGGMAIYMARFLTQFYYHEIGGPLVVSMLLMLFQLLLTTFIRIPVSTPVYRVICLLTFLPAIAVWAFLIDADAMLSWFISLLLSLSVASLTIRMSNNRKRRICTLLFSILLFITVGAGYATFLFILMGWELIKCIREERRSDLFFILATTLFIGLTLPAVATLFYSYPYQSLLLGVNYYRYPEFDTPERGISLVISAVTPLVCFSFSTHPIKKVLRTVLIPAIGTLLISSIYIIYRVDLEEERIFQYDYLMRMQRWDKIRQKATQQPPPTHWEQCALNLSLAHEGTLCERLFAFPHKGRESLLPIYKQDYLTPLFAGEPYFYLGMINSSQRFAFEAMEAIPDYQKSGRCYQRLATTNLINGYYAVASHYLRHLSKSPFYKEWAQAQQPFIGKDSLINNDPLLGKIRQVRLKENFYMNEPAIELALEKLVREESTNEIAWQYLFALCLSAKRVGALAEYATLYQETFRERRLPTLVQEALALSWLQNNQQLDDSPFEIEEKIKQQLFSFMKTLQQSSKASDSVLKKYYGETFWYYAWSH